MSDKNFVVKHGLQVGANTIIDANANIYANSLFNLDGTPISIGGGTDTWVRDQANSAFNKANTVGVTSQSAFDVANSASVTSSSAFAKANASFNYANTINVQPGFNQANLAFDKANAAFSYANTINVQPGFNKANDATVLAQSSFDKANSGTVLAQSAFTQANTGTTLAQSSYTQANTGTTLAQAAFIKANASFDAANTKYNISGGTITGDVTIEGQANVYQRLSVGTGAYSLLPNLISQFTGVSSTYSQVNQQNINGDGSGDFVVTADNGTDLAYYTDLGKAGSNNYYGTLIQPNDTYLIGQGNDGYIEGSNVHIISQTSGFGDIVFAQGGALKENEVGRFIYNQGLVIKGSIVANTIIDGDVNLKSLGQAGFDKANASFNYANTINVQPGFNQANLAFDKANTAYDNSSAAFVTANSAFTSANNAQVTATASFSAANVAAANASLALTTANNALPKSGGTATGVISITNTTQSITPDSGALIVSGGVGVARNLNVGGDAIIAGSLTVQGAQYITSTTTSQYTNPIISLHAPATGYITNNDGYDIGIDYQYYSAGAPGIRVVTSGGGDGTTATLNISDSGYLAPNTVIIVSGVTPSGFNGTYSVTSSTPGSVSYLNSTSGQINTTGALGTLSRQTEIAVNSLVYTGGPNKLANVTFGGTFTSITLPVGLSVTLTGIVPSGYNGTTVVNTSGPGWISVGVGGNSGTYVSGGKVIISQRHAFAGRANDTGAFEFYKAGNFTPANTFEGIYGTVKAGVFLASPSQSISADDITSGGFIRLPAATIYDNSTAANGIVAQGSMSSFGIVQLNSVNANVIYRNTSTVYIAGAPTAGNNVVMSGNTYALEVASGLSWFGGDVEFHSANGVAWYDGSKQYTAAAPYAYSNASFLQANSAFNAANSKVASVTGTTGEIVVTGTTTPTINLASTSVTPGTYGGSSQIPVITIDAKGRATYAGNVSVTLPPAGVVSLTSNSQTQITTNSSSGNIVFGLASTGVTAGSYHYYSDLQVDAQGRILSVTPASIMEPMGNAAFTAANTAQSTGAAAQVTATAAFTAANTAQVTATSAFTAANTAQVTATSAFTAANTAQSTGAAAQVTATSAFTAANTAQATGAAAQVTATSAFTAANTSQVTATAAFTAANTKVTSVTGTSPVVSSGGTTPVISMSVANTTTNGYLTSTDWNTFNGKQASLGFTPVQQGGGTGQGTNKIYIGWATSQLFLQVDATNFGATWPINISGTASNGITTTTGSAPYYGARAWINFNGSGGASIRASGNVNSVTRTGTGQYYMTFTTAMPDTSYCAQITIDSSSASSYQGDSNFGASSSSNFYFNTHDYGNSYVDNTYISVAIFR